MKNPCFIKSQHISKETYEIKQSIKNILGNIKSSQLCLYPFPSITSLLRCKTVASDLVLCRSLFENDASLSELDAWKSQGESVPVCTFCFEIMGEGLLQNEFVTNDSFYVSYDIQLDAMNIEINAIKLCCSHCRKVLDFDKSTLLSALCLSTDSLSCTPKVFISQLHLYQKGLERYQEFKNTIDHFFNVNSLHPLEHASTFQSTLSLIYTLLICSRSFKWTLTTCKPTFKSLFSCNNAA